MATLYEIDSAILDCIDMETGEIIDLDKLNSLKIQREQKLENIALYIKNLKSDVEEFKKEKENFIMYELGKLEAKLETIKNMLCNPDSFVSGEDIRRAMGWQVNSKEGNDK